MLTDERELMTLPDLQERLQISRATVYELISRDGLPMPIKIGRSNRWIVTEIAAWLAERKRAAIHIETRT